MRDDFQMMIIGLFLNLLIFGLLIFGIKRLFSQSHKHAQKEGGVRRFFQLGLLFGLTIVSAIGISGLLGRLIRIGVVLNTDRGNLALESAFTLVGVPILFAVVMWLRNSVEKDKDELLTFGWNLYLTAISIVSLILVIDAQFNLYQGTFTDEVLRGKDISQLLVWAAIWIFHFRFHNQVGRGENSLGEHLIGSLFGLGFTFVGLINAIGGVLNQLIGLTEKEILVSAPSPIINGLIQMAIGIPIWYLYWVRTAQNGVKEALWYAYVLLIGVGGGLIATLVSATLLLNTILVWFFGESTSTAQLHFQASPQLIAAASSALIVLWYHRQVLKDEQTVARNDIHRIYEYVISGIALIAASGGVTMILVSIIESLFDTSQLTGPSSVNSLIAAITLIAVGGPVWWLRWSSTQKKVVADPKQEQGSIVRRVYLLLLFGVVGVTAVIVLISTAYLLFYDLFQGGINTNTVNKIRFPLAIFLTAAVISQYHWSIYRLEKDVEVIKAREELVDEKLYFFVELKIKPRSAAKLIDVLDKYAAHVRKESGCEKLDVLIDRKMKNTVYLYEIWSNSDAHKAHLASEGFAGWKAYSDPLITSFEVKQLTSEVI